MAGGQTDEDREKKLAALKRKRGMLKGRITTVKSFLEKTVDPSKTVIQMRLADLDKVFPELQAIQSEIEELTGDEDELQYRDEFEVMYFTLKDNAQIMCSTVPVTIENLADNTVAVNENVANPAVITQTADPCKLPSLDLVKFDGDVHNWYEFKDSFESLINANASIADVNKLRYLKASVTGAAALTISSLSVTSANYSVAWELLRSRFENNRVIIRKHVYALLDLPQMNKDSARSLRVLTDGVRAHLNALKALDCPTDQWNDLTINILLRKLDPNTNREWEIFLQNKKEHTLDEMISFLEHKCNAIESSGSVPHTTNFERHNNPKPEKSRAMYSTSPGVCELCKGQRHPVYMCHVFKSFTLQKRIDYVRENRLCLNCLGSGHRANACKSRSCAECGRRHHTLIHLKDKLNYTCTYDKTTKEVTSLLATALIMVGTDDGSYKQCRVLLDSGAQSNFFTTSFAKSLGIKHENIDVPVIGIGKSRINISQQVKALITSRDFTFQSCSGFLVLPEITKMVPECSYNTENWNLPPKHLRADPEFNIAGSIDGILGAAIFWGILGNQIRQGPNGLMLRESKLGWIIAGEIDMTNVSRVCHLQNAATDNLTSAIERFWLQESVESANNESTTRDPCEEHFLRTHSRDESGRYIVQLPITSPEDIAGIGESRTAAFKRFLGVEKRLNRNRDLGNQYRLFMKEYQELEHMKPIEYTEALECPGYYLPHHAVLNESSTTTKLRVVFDASCPSSTGISLNDALRVGPKVQQDLFDILVRFRKHKFALAADISKMYRQIRLHDDDKHLHRILWRENKWAPLQTFELQTLTYGTASASYLATRCLLQLAEDEGNSFPEAASVLKTDFYVDDLLTGTADRKQAINLRNQLQQLLARGGFPLRKWNSNERAILQDIVASDQDVMVFNDDATVKTLGMRWNMREDTFTFEATAPKIKPPLTKRKILASIATLFDPLGIMGPYVVRAKILMQELWGTKLGWDDEVPANVIDTWQNYATELKELKYISVPRFAFLDISNPFEIHAFCDASERAYAACVYIVQSDQESGCAKSTLISAKTRVAPLKTVSIPRLELLGAILLSRLVTKVIKSLDIGAAHVCCWTDSMIVLHWLNKSPKQWKQFVANRVSEIQGNTLINIWKHVSSNDNPADIASRGASARKLKESSLWWHGPEWITNSERVRSTQALPQLTNLPEQRKDDTTALHTRIDKHIFYDLVNKYSSFRTIIRVVSWSLRFINQCRKQERGLTRNYLTVKELRLAESTVVRMVQYAEFEDEIKDLSHSKLCRLLPFIDEEDRLLRVGGRLRNSDLPYATKHPAILPAYHKLTTLIITNEHARLLHAGPNATLSSLRERYWPLKGRRAVSECLRRCVRCFKYRPLAPNPIMGDLPEARVTLARPFVRTGVDYCGPIIIKEGGRRSKRCQKAYIAVFVCMSTKACHLELVSDLTTDAFLAAMCRFIARRGIPSDMFSDNGTNFVGANNAIKDFFKTYHEEVTTAMADKQIKWHFNPAHAPNFGGLWEAAVKSAKRHLFLVIGETKLTFEETSTLLAQIEAVLNSRPLTPLSEDPDDLLCLTPGHFLIGTSLMEIPYPDLSSIKLNRLSRWQHLQKMKQHFWQRWSQEYLHHLQNRPKQRGITQKNLEENQLVLIMEETAPLHWVMGRIVSVSPGADGVVRVAKVKTPKGVLSRPTRKLCPLPF